MGQYLLVTYPLAVVAEGYAFYAQRGRRWAWAAYLLVVIPVLFALMAGNAPGFLTVLCFTGLLGVYGWLKGRQRNRIDLDLTKSARP